MNRLVRGVNLMSFTSHRLLYATRSENANPRVVSSS